MQFLIAQMPNTYSTLVVQAVPCQQEKLLSKIPAMKTWRDKFLGCDFAYQQLPQSPITKIHGLIGNPSCKPPGGSRGLILQSPKVLRGHHWGGLQWLKLHFNSTPTRTGDKHTHTSGPHIGTTECSLDLCTGPNVDCHPLICHNLGINHEEYLEFVLRSSALHRPGWLVYWNPYSLFLIACANTVQSTCWMLHPTSSGPLCCIPLRGWLL